MNKEFEGGKCEGKEHVVSFEEDPRIYMTIEDAEETVLSESSHLCPRCPIRIKKCVPIVDRWVPQTKRMNKGATAVVHPKAVTPL